LAGKKGAEDCNAWADRDSTARENCSSCPASSPSSSAAAALESVFFVSASSFSLNFLLVMNSRPPELPSAIDNHRRSYIFIDQSDTPACDWSMSSDLPAMISPPEPSKAAFSLWHETIDFAQRQKLRIGMKYR
jgi:hypothetical protein